MSVVKSDSFSSLYRNHLKNREFGKEAPQNFDSERATIAERQGASENQNSEAKPTLPKTDSSGDFGINELFDWFKALKPCEAQSKIAHIISKYLQAGPPPLQRCLN